MTDTDLPKLSGPSRAPAAGGPPRQLVIFLHGYGADGPDLIGLAPFFAQALPHAEFLSPNAPERCDMGFGYQWFSRENFGPDLLPKAVRKVAPVLDAFVDEALKARNLTYDQLALIGFSQGTMMALDRTMRRGDAAAVVGFSGMVADPSAALPKGGDAPAGPAGPRHRRSRAAVRQPGCGGARSDHGRLQGRGAGAARSRPRNRPGRRQPRRPFPGRPSARLSRPGHASQCTIR